MNKSKLGIFLLSAIFLSGSLLSPSLALADNKGKGKNEEKKEIKIAMKEEKRQNQELKKGNKFVNNICWNGFFKKHLPFGIWKKWVGPIADDCIKVRGGTASSTPDTVAPVISNIITRTTIDKAFISWNTNEKASGKIYYSTTSPVNTNNASTKYSFEIGQGKNHYLGLGGLVANTTYYALVESKDPSGNTSTSSQFSFTTKVSTTTPVDNTAPILSNINTTSTSTSIGVTWQTNEVATSKVYYSTTSPLSIGSTTPFVSNSSLSLNHSLSIDGLATGTPVYMIITSEDSVGNTATSSQFSTSTTSGL